MCKSFRRNSFHGPAMEHVEMSIKSRKKFESHIGSLKFLNWWKARERKIFFLFRWQHRKSYTDHTRNKKNVLL